MNMDVAKLVMDQKTTSKMGGLVVVDHYVSTPKQLTDGLLQISKQSGGKVMLGEWGVPIPDINGKMTDEQRAKWMTEALKNMTGLGDNLIGVNYWLALGGSTALWSDKDLKSSGMSEVVKKYYSPGVIYGRILDEFGQPVEGAKVSIDGNDVFSQADGYYQYNTVEPVDLITISHEDFKQNFVVSPELDEQTDIILEKENKNFISKLLSWIEKIPCLNSLNC